MSNNCIPKEIEALRNAMKQVDIGYYEIKRYNTNNPTLPTCKTRERTYCYELYHQLRNLTAFDDGFTIHAEIDKRGQKGFKGENPDFVIHHPGAAGGLMVIEVKINTAASGITTDIEKLNGMIECRHYQYGVFILVGKNMAWLRKWRKELLKSYQDKRCDRIYIITQTWANFNEKENRKPVVEVELLKTLIDEVK